MDEQSLMEKLSIGSIDRMHSLLVTKLHPDAQLPLRKSMGAAGWDLYSYDDVEIPPNGHRVISTGICISLPAGCYGRIAPRSGLAVTYGLDVLGGVIDPDYRGEIKIILQNNHSFTYGVDKRDRVAQLILEKYCVPPMYEVESLDTTERGENGFGSTGDT